MADEKDVKDQDKNDKGEKGNRATGREPSAQDEPVGEPGNPPPPTDPGDIETPGKNP